MQILNFIRPGHCCQLCLCTQLGHYSAKTSGALAYMAAKIAEYFRSKTKSARILRQRKLNEYIIIQQQGG
jgi:hypothetical protein